jgi:hypothetical protein
MTWMLENLIDLLYEDARKHKKDLIKYLDEELEERDDDL